jgi:hypothetical protein
MTTSAFARTRRELPSLGSWVTRLMADYPWFDEYDLSEMIEEKTGFVVTEDDFLVVRSYYLRSKLRAWSSLVPEDPEDQ